MLNRRVFFVFVLQSITYQVNCLDATLSEKTEPDVYAKSAQLLKLYQHYNNKIKNHNFNANPQQSQENTATNNNSKRNAEKSSNEIDLERNEEEFKKQLQKNLKIIAREPKIRLYFLKNSDAIKDFALQSKKKPKAGIKNAVVKSKRGKSNTRSKTKIRRDFDDPKSSEHGMSIELNDFGNDQHNSVANKKRKTKTKNNNDDRNNFKQETHNKKIYGVNKGRPLYTHDTFKENDNEMSKKFSQKKWDRPKNEDSNDMSMNRFSRPRKERNAVKEQRQKPQSNMKLRNSHGSGGAGFHGFGRTPIPMGKKILYED